MNKIEKLKSCPFCGEEARIEVIKPHTHKLATFMPDCEGRSFVECQCGAAISGETRDAAIAAWNRRAEQNPKPLTLDELIRMDGEPIWTVTIGLKGSGRWELCEGYTIRACPFKGALRCVDLSGEATLYDYKTYGKTWLAYRTKPEWSEE